MKKALKESEEKVEKVTIDKVKHETEAKMMTMMNQNLEQMLAMIQKTGSVQVAPLSPAATAPAADSSRETDKRKFKCYKYEKGLCKDEHCNFSHPTELCEEFSKKGLCNERSCVRLHKGNHKGDCYFWKQGKCRYDEEDCGKGLHRLPMFDYYNQVKGNTVPNSLVQQEQARKEQARKEQEMQKEQQMQKEHQGWQAAAMNQNYSAAPASFLGGGQGIVGPPINPPALSPETISTVVQYLLSQAAARGGRQ